MRLSKYHSFFIASGAVLWALSVSMAAQVGPASWQGTLRDARGNIMAGTQVDLSETASGRTLTTITDAQGAFSFPKLLAGNYAVRIRWHNKTTTSREVLKIQPGSHLNSSVQVAIDGVGLILQTTAAAEQPKASGGEKLSSREVSELPLNKRDFSQLLLLAKRHSTLQERSIVGLRHDHTGIAIKPTNESCRTMGFDPDWLLADSCNLWPGTLVNATEGLRHSTQIRTDVSVGDREQQAAPRAPAADGTARWHSPGRGR